MCFSDGDCSGRLLNLTFGSAKFHWKLCLVLTAIWLLCSYNTHLDLPSSVFFRGECGASSHSPQYLNLMNQPECYEGHSTLTFLICLITVLNSLIISEVSCIGMSVCATLMFNGFSDAGLFRGSSRGSTHPSNCPCTSFVGDPPCFWLVVLVYYISLQASWMYCILLACFLS